MRLTAYNCIRPYLNCHHYVSGSKETLYKMCQFIGKQGRRRAINRACYRIKNVKDGRDNNGGRMKHTHNR